LSLGCGYCASGGAARASCWVPACCGARVTAPPAGPLAPDRTVFFAVGRLRLSVVVAGVRRASLVLRRLARAAGHRHLRVVSHVAGKLVHSPGRVMIVSPKGLLQAG
jgi:hypothetical protein